MRFEEAMVEGEDKARLGRVTNGRSGVERI